MTSMLGVLARCEHDAIRDRRHGKPRSSVDALAEAHARRRPSVEVERHLAAEPCGRSGAQERRALEQRRALATRRADHDQTQSAVAQANHRARRALAVVAMNAEAAVGLDDQRKALHAELGGETLIRAPAD